MAEPHAFRRAAEAKDLDLLIETLREDVELHSPILFRGFEGRDVVAQVLTHVATTLENLTYVDELHEGSSVALRFTANVGDRELEGIDLLHHDGSGAIDRLTVMIRPLSALQAVATAMREKLT